MNYIRVAAGVVAAFTMASFIIAFGNVALGFVISLGVLTTILRLAISTQRKRRRNGSKISIGYVHPHALSGGGGERVLWAAVHATLNQYQNAEVVIFSAWPSGQNAIQINEEARRKALTHFGLDLGERTFQPVCISDITILIEADRYPRFTLVLQAIGAFLLGTLTFLRHPCDIVIDTANLSFGLIVPKVLGARTVSYVHYPTISEDMLSSVANRETAVHNDSTTAASPGRTKIKLLYYRAFAVLYRLAAGFVDTAMANSTWTKRHLACVWKRDVPVVFPPCRVPNKRAEGLARTGACIVSVGQFRPEKRHGEQLRIVQQLVERGLDCKLMMIGGARDDEDVARAETIRARALEEGLPVEILLNVPRRGLAEGLAKAAAGLHTMRHEHFGIGVVELMVAGVIVVAHRSGGVELDIVEHGVNGFLADDEEEFADVLERVLKMGLEERQAVCDKAVNSCGRFSEEVFQNRFVEILDGCIHAVR